MISILILFFISLFLILFLIKKRKSLYKYDVKKDYIYDMKSANWVFDINIQDNNMICSIKNIKYDTAILDVNIASTLLGKIKQPYIIIKQGENKFSQYFEYGAKGKRYLNIPNCINFEDAIQLETYNCNIIKQYGKLFIFNNEINLNGNICIIAPHPDDAEIAAYGLYSSCKNVNIITVSASESGKVMYKDFSLKTKEQLLLKGIRRTVDSITVPLIASVKPDSCINYGYYGCTLEELYNNKDEITPNIKIHKNTFRKLNVITDILKNDFNLSWKSLVDDFKYTLSKINVNIIVLPHPILDSHSDHKYTTKAVLEALKELNIKDMKILFYINHNKLSESYPYGNEGSLIPFPPNFLNSLQLKSVYSRTLNSKAQIEKAIALESMSILRPYFPWQKASTIVNRVFKNKMNKIYGKRLDYFSRSVRSNELFFVFDLEDII